MLCVRTFGQITIGGGVSVVMNDVEEGEVA